MPRFAPLARRAALLSTLVLTILCPSAKAAAAAATVGSNDPVDAACRAGARQPAPAVAARLADLALEEYRSFNGHRIDADGRLWKFGSVEGETELLHDPATGAESAAQADRFAWRRVWHYWQTLGEHRPAAPLSRRITYVPGLLDDPASEARALSFQLGELLERLQGLDAGQAAPLRDAVVRTALIDSPWSGAFISYVMHRAGLDDAQFQFSGAHADYIRKAFEQPDGYAYRACDVRRTMPRVGDLICYSRGAHPFDGFAAWRAAVPTLGGGVKSHCDLVVEVDQAARKIEVVGGNVLQSVTRRRLKLNEAGTLSDSHQAGMARKAPGSACARDVTCARANLNLQYWGVLLQLR